MNARSAVEAASRRLRNEWEKILESTNSCPLGTAAGRRRHGGLALVILLIALLAGTTLAELPPEGSSKGIWWRPSGIEDVALVRADAKGAEIPVLIGELEKRIVQGNPASWIRQHAEAAGRRWDATLRHYYPDSETPARPVPFIEISAPCAAGDSFSAKDDELASPYVRVGLGGREFSISRSAMNDLRAETGRTGASLCDAVASTPYILPESLRPNFSKMTRAEFREALVAAPELDAADFMRLHRAHLALAKSRGPGAEVYPRSAPILPDARDLNPPKPIAMPASTTPAATPLRWNKGYIGAAIGAVLVLIVLIASILRS